MDYYTAPSDAIFEEIKRGATAVWNMCDDQYGYATEKINRIKDLQNIKDNAWYMVAMFDQHNQIRLMLEVNPETAQAIGLHLEEEYEQFKKLRNQ